MYFFFMPMVYLFKSRLKSKIESTSWLIAYVVPVAALAYISSAFDVFDFLAIFILALLGFFSLYETGYIENDIKTTQKESQPTIRIEKPEQLFLEENYRSVQLGKTVISVTLLFFAELYADVFEVELYWLQFIVCLCFMRLSFYAHNQIRSRWNVLTFFCLSISKCFSFFLLFMPLVESLGLLLLSVFMSPFLRMLEHATKPKYGFHLLSDFVGNHDVFRVKYYFLIFLLTLVGLWVYGSELSIVAAGVLAYYLLYRMAALFVLSKKPDAIKSMRGKRDIK